MTALLEVVDVINRKSAPTVVGISGFGGSGKSTLARAIAAAISGSARIRGDDFLDPERSHRRSSDWNGMERTRLREEVLDRFRSGRPGVFRRFDWDLRKLSNHPEPIPEATVLIVDGVGLFHPELDGAFDITVWVDADLEEATRRGKIRDHRQGSDHDQLWDDVWVPNERDFIERFGPREHADILFDNL